MLIVTSMYLNLQVVYQFFFVLSTAVTHKVTHTSCTRRKWR